MQPRCAHCRYHLSGIPAGPCPECGQPFDPADPTTLHQPAQILLDLATLRPPRWVLVALALIVLPTILLTDSPSRGLAEGTAVLWVFAILVPALAGILWLLPHLVGRVVLRLSRYPAPRWSRRWLLPPVLIAAAMAAQKYNVVWNLRWLIARPSLERFVANPCPTPCVVAGFSITDVEHLEGGTTVLHLGYPDRFYSDAPPQLIHTPPDAPDPMRPFGGARYPIPRNATLGNHWHAWVDES